jgi:hypothetical protein
MRAAMNAVMDAQGDQRRERLEAAIDLMQQIENHWAEALQMVENQDGGYKRKQKTLRRRKQKKQKTLRKKKQLHKRHAGGEGDEHDPSLVAKINKQTHVVDAMEKMVEQLHTIAQTCHEDGDKWRECVYDKTGVKMEPMVGDTLKKAVNSYTRLYHEEEERLKKLTRQLPFRRSSHLIFQDGGRRTRRRKAFL